MQKECGKRLDGADDTLCVCKFLNDLEQIKSSAQTMSKMTLKKSEKAQAFQCCSFCFRSQEKRQPQIARDHKARRNHASTERPE